MHGDPADRRAKRDMGVEAIRKNGGIDTLIRNPHSDSTRRVLTILILILSDDRAPSSPEISEAGRSGDDAFVARVLSKAAYELPKLADLTDYSEGQKELELLRIIQREAKRVRREGRGRYDSQKLPPVDPESLVQVVDPHSVESPSAEDWPPSWWVDFKSMALAQHPDWAPIIHLFEDCPEEFESLLKDDGKLDIGKVSGTLGIPKRVIQEFVRFLKASKKMVPHGFEEIHRRLTELAATPFKGLVDPELRATLFDISRALAHQFRPEESYARAVKNLDAFNFDEAVGLVLDERDFRRDQPGQRRILDRLRESIRHVVSALDAGDIGRAFIDAQLLVLDAVRIQHYMSPARLQLLLSYSYFLRSKTWCDAYIRANRIVADRCDAIVRIKGQAEFDRPPEFESGETLRRVKTYAMLNGIVGSFYFKLTTARQERFVLERNYKYEDLVSLIGRLEEVLRFDPEAEFAYEEMLIISAHIVRAAYNLFRKAKPAAKEHLRQEREQRAKDLVRLLETQFLTSDVPEENARAVIESARARGEGCARERALDVIEDVLWSTHRSVARAIRKLRQAPPKGSTPR